MPPTLAPELTTTVKRSPWERVIHPKRKRPIILTARDRDLVAFVYTYRVLRPSDLHRLLGGSLQKLKRRCRLLYDAEYLDRPKSQRSTRALTEELLYAVTNRGAKLAVGQDPLPFSSDFNDANRRITYAFMTDHLLAVNEFLITLRLGAGAYSYTLRWPGHDAVPTVEVNVDGMRKTCVADALFSIEHPRRGFVPCFLELDRGTVPLSKMRERYERYFRWWQTETPRAVLGRQDFRVLTVTNSPERMQSLRWAAASVGRSREFPEPWRGFLFASQDAYDPVRPQTMIERIFHFAGDEAPVSLLE